MILRDYQTRLVARAQEALADYGNTLAVAPTGAGKSIMLSALGAKIDGPHLILQHREELSEQNSRKWKAVNPGHRIGYFNAAVKSWNADATFAMVQTLAGHVDSIPPLAALTVDEAHHAVAGSYLKIIDAAREKNPGIKIIGFTATPGRGDGKGLRRVFDNCCDQITLSELVALGFLVRPRTYMATLEGVADELARIKPAKNDFAELAEAAAVLDRPVHNKTVVREWARLAGERKTIVFCSTVAHAEHVVEAFIREGVRTECVTGQTKDRARVLQEFEQGETQVLVNVAVLTEGYDCPPCSCVVLLRPCSYKSTMMQMIGRGLRVHDGKKDCLVLDFGTSLATHGNLEQRVQLDDRDKLCPECGAKVPGPVAECPICGHEFRRETQEVGGRREDEEDSISTVELVETDIMEQRPFKWIDLFGSGRVMMASGFDAWTAVCSPNGEDWTALGKVRTDRTLRALLTGGTRAAALSTADDFLRLSEDDGAAKKSKHWLKDPATEKQWALLERVGYQRAGFDFGMTKYSSMCHLNFQWNRRAIEQAIGA